jgi:hypothetical protein
MSRVYIVLTAVPIIVDGTNKSGFYDFVLLSTACDSTDAVIVLEWERGS